MKSPFYFIARPEKGTRYNNVVNWEGIEFTTNTSEEEHKFSNRIAEVIELPIGYTGPIKIGYTLLVHHNVFKFYNDMRGRRKSGKSFFKDDLFFVDDQQFFMYNDGEKWNSYDRYCFVSPIPSEECYLHKPTNEPLMGKMRYSNDYLTSRGIDEGTHVSFTPDSEYEFEVDGEKMYRIFDHQITLAL
tara:strand:- start:786 stop:1346 length:561 start_codon:yes stop_codon:yes gene_type:complete